MSNLRKQIQSARPSLRLVSPLAYWTVLVMTVFNILLGFSFLFLVDQTRFTAPLLMVNDVLTFKFWGFVFIGIGLLKLYSIITNNWNLARRSLILGVSIKAAWMVALIFRVIVSPGTFFLSLLWATVALLQMGAYIWFMPPAIGKYQQRKTERENE